MQRRCTRGGSPVISVEQPPRGIAFQRLIYQAPGAGHNIALAWTCQRLHHHFNDTFPLGLLVDSRVVDVLAPGSASPVFMHGPCHFSHGPLSMWAVARHTPPAPGAEGGRRTGLPRQTVMKSCQVRACYHGGRPEWPQCSWRASHGAAISTPSCGRLCTSPVTRSLTLSQVLLQLPYDQKLQA